MITDGQESRIQRPLRPVHSATRMPKLRHQNHRG